MSPNELIEILLDRTIGLAIILMTEDGNVCWVNRGACTLFGCAKEEELVGSAYERLFIAEDRARGVPGNEKSIALARGFSEDDRWHQRLDGSRFWANGVLTALRDDEGHLHGFGKVLRNRTELKEQVVELTLRTAALEEREGVREKSIATAAHEFRNALAGIAGIVAASQRPSADVAQIAAFAPIAARQMKVMERLTDDLLDIAGVRSESVLPLKRTVMQRVVEEAAVLIQSALGKRKFWLLAPPGPVECEINEERMQQVLGNLLRNALKFTSDHGRIWLKLTIEGDEAVIRVEDDGRGIEPTNLSQIFEAFTQVQAPRDRADGIGMGLTIARDLVRAQRGTIQAVSDGLGTGASFIVRLPIAEGTE